MSDKQRDRVMVELSRSTPGTYDTVKYQVGCYIYFIEDERVQRGLLEQIGLHEDASKAYCIIHVLKEKDIPSREVHRDLLQIWNSPNEAYKILSKAFDAEASNKKFVRVLHSTKRVQRGNLRRDSR